MYGTRITRRNSQSPLRPPFRTTYAPSYPPPSCLPTLPSSTLVLGWGGGRGDVIDGPVRILPERRRVDSEGGPPPAPSGGSGPWLSVSSGPRRHSHGEECPTSRVCPTSWSTRSVMGWWVGEERVSPSRPPGPGQEGEVGSGKTGRTEMVRRGSPRTDL